MKKKIDNRATCTKLETFFMNYKIRNGHDVKKIMEEIVDRTRYGYIQLTERRVYYDDENEFHYFEDIELIYPNSKIKVTLFIDGDAGMLDFKIYWSGRQNVIKYKESDSVFFEDFPVKEDRLSKKLRLLKESFQDKRVDEF